MTPDSKKNRNENNGQGAGETPSSANPQSETRIEVLASDYEALKKRVEELEGLREKFLHAAADFENAKKRNIREKEEFIKFSQERTLKEMIPVLDNFGRALVHTTAAELAEADEEKLRENFRNVAAGVKLVQKQFSDILKNHGLVRLKTVGEKFDPHRHEVVGYVAEQGGEDVIVDELEAGYMLHDRLLRAAKVRVRVAPSSEDPEKQDEIT